MSETKTIQIPALPKPITSSKHWDVGIDRALAGERAARLEREEQLQDALRRIAALEADLATAHATLQRHEKMAVELRSENEKLKAPVSDEELMAVIPKLSRYVSERLLITRWKDGIDIEEPNGNARFLVDTLIAARSAAPAKVPA